MEPQNLSKPPSTRIRKVGNTTIISHSPHGLHDMTPEEKQAWFDSELAKGNPVVVNIAETLETAYERRMLREMEAANHRAD